MQSVRVPWSAWYEQREFELEFPEDWSITVAEMVGGPDIGDSGTRAAFESPIGAQPLREYARGKRSAAILVDDLSRPTPAYRLLPYVLEELAAAGIGEDRVKVIGAVAAHRAMTRDDFVKKVGQRVVDRVHVLNHNAYGNLAFLGHSSRGVPIYVNRDFMSCEVRIALGMITPRGNIFGGGSKLVLPGASGHVTIVANHRYVQEGFREHLAEVAEMAGLGYIVNAVLNSRLELIALVTGHPEEAYWHGVSVGKELYATEFPDNVDVGVFNAFPKDTELLQAGLALVPLRGSRPGQMAENAAIVIAAACPEGMGWHTVYMPGAELSGKPSPPRRNTILFSPGINQWDARSKFSDEITFCRAWPEVLDTLKRRHPGSPHVAVFPCGAIQYCE